MATKNNPGTFDCYAAADPDEPLFILRGRDPMGGALVRLWAALRELKGGEDPKKIAEARECAKAMDQWARKAGKTPWTLQDGRGLLMKLASKLDQIFAP